MNDRVAPRSTSGSRAAAADEAQAEIAALRDSLARAEQGMADGFAAADALLTELTELATLRRTERRALARAEWKLKETQAEIAVLRDKLVAAREAGKAALASLLRDQAVAAAEVPRGGGGLAPMLRRIGSRTAWQLQRFGRKASVSHWPIAPKAPGNGSARPAYIGRPLIAILSIRRYGFNTVMR
jgi:hypothetical protein